MTMIQNVSRRDVLKGAGTTTALVLGAHVAPFSLVPPAKAAATSVQPTSSSRSRMTARSF